MRATSVTPRSLLSNLHSKTYGKAIATTVAIGAAVSTTAPALADEFNMPVGVTDISREVYDLHMGIFYVCCVIGAVVFGVMIWSMLQHRKSLGAVAETWHESTKVELAWTIIPTFILIGMAIPATDVLRKMYDTGGEDMLVEVRGYQLSLIHI